MKQLRIAVVIPTLNEENRLRRILPPLADSADQIVVSDGGSVDDTVAVAHRNRAQVVVGPKGRGLQLNNGATVCDADAYIFLHADTELPAGSLPAIREALDNGFVGGGFFVTFDSSKPVFRFGSWMINLRTRLTRAPLGDQAQFASRRAFESIGGFMEWPILEDLDF
ncbi:MAG: glycosyltransferase, partial [Acidobacteriota bacterium]|nr:glycosyltransferase [Acidobacteriota bacterium]